MDKIIYKHIEAWDPIGIASGPDEYGLEVGAICGRLYDHEVITFGALTKIIHDVFAEYFGYNNFSRWYTFAETRTVAEKILADLKAHGYKVSDEYDIPADADELERLRFEEMKILVDAYRDREERFDVNQPISFRLVIEAFCIADMNSVKRGKEAAEKILSAYRTPEEIFQADLNGLEELELSVLAFERLTGQNRRFSMFSTFILENHGDIKFPETFADLVKIMPNRGEVTEYVKHVLIKNSDADYGEHILRVANRTKIAEVAATLDEVLAALRICKPEWSRSHHAHKLFWHGQEICTSEPKCKICPLSKICPSGVV